jgi:outer membrane receptor protein involved in Fe transport
VFGNVAGAVITRGAEAFASVPFGDDLSANVDFTYAAARTSGSSLQFNRIPQTQFKLGLDWHPMAQPFGASLTLQNVGDLSDTLGGGVGRIDYGNYTVLNLGTRLFLDDAHQHRIGLNINNLTDEGYASHLSRGTSDSTGASYLVHERGLPRTFNLSYTFAFH